MPPEPTYSKCACDSCGERIEFPVEAAGTTVDCPHCKFPTVLSLPPPPARPKPGVFKTLLALVVILGALGAALFYWQKHKAASAPTGNDAVNAAPGAPAASPLPTPPAPDLWHGLKPDGPVALEKSGAGNLVYAVGKLRNDSDHQRFGVKVQIDLFNATGAKIGSATDYAPFIDPGKPWKFRAMITDRGAVKAVLTGVTEN